MRQGGPSWVRHDSTRAIFYVRFDRANTVGGELGIRHRTREQIIRTREFNGGLDWGGNEEISRRAGLIRKTRTGRIYYVHTQKLNI